MGVEERRKVPYENVEREKATLEEQEQVRNIISCVTMYVSVQSDPKFWCCARMIPFTQITSAEQIGFG
jgi:hypothetical protein